LIDPHTQGFLDALQRIDARRGKEKEAMPAYDYRCQHCQYTMTIVRGISDEENKPICITCAKVMARSYDTAPAVQFLGIGWGKDG
jgi:putative FmdB family regulatory protein